MTDLIEIGHVEALFRYPVKSMRGQPLDAANLGWHDNRFGVPKVWFYEPVSIPDDSGTVH